MTLPLASVAAQEVVRTTAGSSINAGIWTLVGVIVITIGGVWIAYIRQWGPWKSGDAAARQADFARLREEIAVDRARIDTLERMVQAANKTATEAGEHSMRSDVKLQTALTACEVLLSLVEREMPDAQEIGLVKRLLAQAASDDMGVGAGMRKIAMMKGVGE